MASARNAAVAAISAAYRPDVPDIGLALSSGSDSGAAAAAYANAADAVAAASAADGPSAMRLQYC